MKNPIALAFTLNLALVKTLLPHRARAQTPIPADRAMVAIVSDAELFNVGQDGYCGERTTVNNPSKTKFLIPAGQRTWFFLSSKLHVPSATLTCSGDYSFVPVAGKLHIFRYTFAGDQCLLEHFSAEPGKTPEPTELQPENRRSCLVRDN
nr:hypothetical protein [uncultured Rhodoferax sp.]